MTTLCICAVIAIVPEGPNRDRVAVRTQRHRTRVVKYCFSVDVATQLDPGCGPDIPAVDPRVTRILSINAIVPECPNRHRVAVRTQRYGIARPVTRRFSVDVVAQLIPGGGPDIPAIDPRVTRILSINAIVPECPNRDRVAVRTQRDGMAGLVPRPFSVNVAAPLSPQLRTGRRRVVPGAVLNPRHRVAGRRVTIVVRTRGHRDVERADEGQVVTRRGKIVVRPRVFHGHRNGCRTDLMQFRRPGQRGCVFARVVGHLRICDQGHIAAGGRDPYRLGFSAWSGCDAGQAERVHAAVLFFTLIVNRGHGRGVVDRCDRHGERAAERSVVGGQRQVPVGTGVDDKYVDQRSTVRIGQRGEGDAARCFRRRVRHRG